MSDTKRNAKVDECLSKASRWQKEMQALRELALKTDLDEAFKWGQPCYMFNNKNVFLLHEFKEYFAILFFKGALLKDPEKILVQQTENVYSARQIRFTSLEEVEKLKPVLKAYLDEAVANEKAGLEVPPKERGELEIIDELQAKFDDDSDLLLAFESLTPGRQRAYLLYFSSAKQSKTRTARIEKNMGRILEGKGLND